MLQIRYNDVMTSCKPAYAWIEVDGVVVHQIRALSCHYVHIGSIMHTLITFTHCPAKHNDMS